MTPTLRKLNPTAQDFVPAATKTPAPEALPATSNVGSTLRVEAQEFVFPAKGAATAPVCASTGTDGNKISSNLRPDAKEFVFGSPQVQVPVSAAENENIPHEVDNALNHANAKGTSKHAITAQNDKHNDDINIDAATSAASATEEALEIISNYEQSLEDFIIEYNAKTHPEYLLKNSTEYVCDLLWSSNASGNIVALQPYAGNSSLSYPQRTHYAIHALHFVCHSLYLNLKNPGYGLALVAAAEWFETLSAAWSTCGLPINQESLFYTCATAICRFSEIMDDTHSYSTNLGLEKELFQEFVHAMAVVSRRFTLISLELDLRRSNNKLAATMEASMKIMSACRGDKEESKVAESTTSATLVAPAKEEEAAAAIDIGASVEDVEKVVKEVKEIVDVQQAVEASSSTLRASAKEFVSTQSPALPQAKAQPPAVVAPAAADATKSAIKKTSSTLSATAKEFTVSKNVSTPETTSKKGTSSILKADAKEFVLPSKTSTARASITPPAHVAVSAVPAPSAAAPAVKLAQEQNQAVPASQSVQRPIPAPTRSATAAPAAHLAPVVAAAAQPVVDKENVVPQAASENVNKMTIIRDCLIPLPGPPRSGRTANYMERFAIVNNARRKGLLGSSVN